MEGYAELYCELAHKTRGQLKNVQSLLGRSPKPEVDIDFLPGGIEVIALGKNWKTISTLDNQIILTRSVTKWGRACDLRLAPLICHNHHTTNYKQYCHVGNQAWRTIHRMTHTTSTRKQTVSVSFAVVNPSFSRMGERGGEFLATSASAKQEPVHCPGLIARQIFDKDVDTEDHAVHPPNIKLEATPSVNTCANQLDARSITLRSTGNCWSMKLGATWYNRRFAKRTESSSSFE